MRVKIPPREVIKQGLFRLSTLLEKTAPKVTASLPSFLAEVPASEVERLRSQSPGGRRGGAPGSGSGS